MMDVPQTRYATARDGTSIAFATIGTGPVDILVSHPGISHLEVYWEWPGYGRFVRGLADGGRVILFDKRGVGMSGPTLRDPDLETRVGDIIAVLDEVGSAGAVLFGWGEGAAAAAMLAATNPERIEALVLYAPAVRFLAAPDFPGADRAVLEDDDRRLVASWGDEAAVDFFLHSYCGIRDEALIADPAMRRWGARIQRFACSPDAYLAFDRVFMETDARAILPAVRVPTLVLEASCHAPDPWSREVAARVTGAHFETIERPQWPVWVDASEAFGARVRRFLVELRREEADLDRVLATVLVTDIVDSTRTAAELGDARWRELVNEHDRIARATVARYRGEYVDSRGDGMLATFDGPARAVRCARALAEALRPLGVEVRAGAHIGEVERVDHGIAGLALHTAARVAARAGAGEVWTSSTVKDLTAGSGLLFEDAGDHELKGVPGRWRLYRVVDV